MGIYGNAFKTGFKEARKKEWQCCQFQTRLKYRTNNTIKAREFANNEQAQKFKQKLIKFGYKKSNIHTTEEYISFAGAVCFSSRKLNIVYYSKKKLRLIPENQSLKNEFKLVYKYLIKPHTNKPSKKEVQKFKEILPTKSATYSKTPVCAI